MKKEKFFYLVNVSGIYGYSFMVYSKHCLNDNEVLHLSRELFESETDMQYATIESDVTDYDVAHFEKSKCLFNID